MISLGKRTFKKLPRSWIYVPFTNPNELPKESRDLEEQLGTVIKLHNMCLSCFYMRNKPKWHTEFSCMF